MAREDSGVIESEPSRRREPPATDLVARDGRRGLRALRPHRRAGRAERHARGLLAGARRRVPGRSSTTACRSRAAALKRLDDDGVRDQAHVRGPRGARTRARVAVAGGAWRTRRGGCGYAIARLDTGVHQPAAQAMYERAGYAADRQLQREPVRELLGREGAGGLARVAPASMRSQATAQLALQRGSRSPSTPWLSIAPGAGGWLAAARRPPPRTRSARTARSKIAPTCRRVDAAHARRAAAPHVDDDAVEDPVPLVGQDVLDALPTVVAGAGHHVGAGR